MYQTYYAEAGSTHDVSYSCGIIGYIGRKAIKDTSACNMMCISCYLRSSSYYFSCIVGTPVLACVKQPMQHQPS